MFCLMLEDTRHFLPQLFQTFSPSLLLAWSLGFDRLSGKKKFYGLVARERFTSLNMRCTKCSTCAVFEPRSFNICALFTCMLKV